MERRAGLLRIDSTEPITHLAAWLKASGWTHEQLAQAAGINRTTVHYAVVGVRCGPKATRLLSNITGIAPGDLSSMRQSTTWTVELDWEQTA